jgi:hypothetical protein
MYIGCLLGLCYVKGSDEKAIGPIRDYVLLDLSAFENQETGCSRFPRFARFVYSHVTHLGNQLL